MENSHCLDIFIETTDKLIIDAINFIRTNKKRPDTPAIIDHIVKTKFRSVFPRKKNSLPNRKWHLMAKTLFT